MSNQLIQPTINFSTLLELLRFRAKYQSQQRAYTFLKDGEIESQQLTYGELDRQARAIAAQLQQLGAPGQRVLLLYPPGLEFITAFFGCLYAGMVAAPAYPPRRNQKMTRLQAIVTDAQATLVLTPTSQLTRTQAQFAAEPELANLQWLGSDSVPEALAEQWSAPDLNGETLAFLQYTSGSTGSPKGVMVSHRNILHNERMMQTAFGHSEQTIYVNWMPLFHDMGLIANALQSFYLGVPCYLMSPMDFLQKPVVWLQAISRYRATTSGAPNFAYELCLRRITPEQRASLDLSSWQVALNGAEPVRAETLERFSAAFEPHGFRREAFYPCYGMAESTVFISGGQPQASFVIKTVDTAALAQNRAIAAANSATAQAIVGCGQTWLDQTICIVDPDTCTRCAADQIGEIWVASPSVGQGYWNHPAQTAETFQAFTADPQAGPFMRTGDLGFLQDGELFVTGRLKDLIIIRGRNHYPQDIELTVETSHPALKAGCGAAFAIEENQEEQLVVVQEVKRSYLRKLDTEAVAQAIRRAVAEQHDLQVYAVVLLKTGGILKTSSGKIQRRACRSGFLANSLNQVGRSILTLEVAPQLVDFLSRAALLALPPEEQQTILLSYVQPLVAEVLRCSVDRLDAQTHLTALGLDSLTAIQLISRFRELFAVDLPIHELFEIATLADLGRRLVDALQHPQIVRSPIQPVSRQITLPLSSSQQRLWLLDQIQSDSTPYNLSVALDMAGDLNLAALQQSLTTLVQRHEILRTTFTAVGGEPTQVIGSPPRNLLSLIDLTNLPIPDRASKAQRLTMAAGQYRFNLGQGPLLQATLLKIEANQHRLLITLHHIVADGWSVGVFIQEIKTLYTAYTHDQPNPLPPLSIQYADYAYWQRQWLQGEALAQSLAYWRRQLAGAPPVLELPTDRPRPAIQTFQGGKVNFTLNTELAQQLKILAQSAGATLFMALLAVFAALLGRYSGQSDIVIGSPIANRNRCEIEPLIGFFVNTLVLRTDLQSDPSFQELLARVRRTTLAAYAHNAPFEKLVEALQPQRSLSHSPLFQVMFVFQNTPAGTLELPGLTITPIAREEVAAKFDITLSLAETAEGLSGFVSYNADLFEATTIARMAEHFQTLLSEIVANPQRPLSQLSLLSMAEQSQLLQGCSSPTSMTTASLSDQETVSVEANTEIDHLLAELEGLSEEDAQKLLNDEIFT